MTSTKKSKKFDINYKAVCYETLWKVLRRFLALINHPPPMTGKHYRKISHSFTEAARAVAAEDISRYCNDDNVVDIGVSLDGTWQR